MIYNTIVLEYTEHLGSNSNTLLKNMFVRQKREGEDVDDITVSLF
jgi:hypothetical protein